MRFASLLTVDRHGLSALAMTRCGSDGVYQSRTTHYVIARKERSEGRGNPSCLEGRDRVCLFAYWLTVDRHGLTALAMTR